MQLFGKQEYTIRWNPKGCVSVIDQRLLPHKLEFKNLYSVQDTFQAIKDMVVRGAPLIGATAAYGLVLATFHAKASCNIWDEVESAYTKLLQARPTAVNLKWALDRCMKRIEGKSAEEVHVLLFREAQLIVSEDVQVCEAIGENGLELIKAIYEKKKSTVNILTHCNAGWLACIDWGTATAPIYKAQSEGIPIQVWVDETRPRLQGANLTAFELMQQNIPCKLITDNAGGHYMQHGLVDLVIVGTDRTTRTGDVCNKIGTYLKALAAFDNNIPFYVALPSSTIDWSISNGLNEINIEERNSEEVNFVYGQYQGDVIPIRISPDNCAVGNPGFDVTPARLISGLITEKGICEASEVGLTTLFPEKIEA